MRGGMRLAGAVVALGLLGAAAKADTTYNFDLQPGTVLGLGNPFSAAGFFTLNGVGGVTGGSATLGFGGTTYTLGTTSGLIAASIVNLTFSSAISNVTLNLQGRAPGSSTSFSGSLIATATTPSTRTAETSVFSASASSGSSGGVPTPEVNTLVGIALAGGSVAFLRRRRGNRTMKAAA